MTAGNTRRSARICLKARSTTRTLGDRSTRGGAVGSPSARPEWVAGVARLSVAAGLQRGHGRGASPSKPSIRVAASHSPHHGGRDGRCGCGEGSSVGESRAASTAYGLRSPLVFAPVNAARVCGVQPASSAVVTAGASLARWAAVSRQSAPSAAKNSLTGLPPPAASAACGHSRAGAAGSPEGSLYGSGATTAPRDCTDCTPFARWLHPAPAWGATAAPRPPSYPQHSRGEGDDCTPSK